MIKVLYVFFTIAGSLVLLFAACFTLARRAGASGEGGETVRVLYILSMVITALSLLSLVALLLHATRLAVAQGHWVFAAVLLASASSGAWAGIRCGASAIREVLS